MNLLKFESGKLAKLGEALKKIDPQLTGPPAEVAKHFVARNPEYIDLISDEVKDVVLDDIEPDYIWPFHSPGRIAADRQAAIKTNVAKLDFLAKSQDLLEALRRNVSVSVLPQIQLEEAQARIQAQLLSLQTQCTNWLEEQRERRRLEAQVKLHELSTVTLDQTGRLTRELNNNDLDNKLRQLREEIDQELRKVREMNQEQIQHSYKTLEFKKKKFEQEMEQRKQQWGK